MTDFDWKALEDAVLEALQARIGSLVKTVESYQGDWRRDLQNEGWRLPAVLVMLSGARSETVALRSDDLTVDLTVLAMVRQLRGQAAGRRQEGGVYQIMAGSRQALWHQDLGLEILPLILVREEPLLNNREFSVYASHYRTGAVVDW